MGYSIIVARHGTVFLADTAINETPSPEQLAHDRQADGQERPHHGPSSRASPSPRSPTSAAARSSASTASARRSACSTAEKVDFEYDGEMQADMALDYKLLKSTYPFARLTGPANVLVMPGLHSAHISSRLMQSLGGVTVIGPVIDGLAKPVQIVQMGATVSRSRQPRRARRLWRAQPQEVSHDRPRHPRRHRRRRAGQRSDPRRRRGQGRQDRRHRQHQGRRRARRSTPAG